MFLRLWNYIRGYVMIEVTGFSVERFVNLAVHKGIYIWDVTPKGTGVTMKVSIKGFRLLKSCSKKTKCRVKIVQKFGCPFTVYRYRKRQFYVAGLVFFIAVLYVLSSFIWLIQIEGNERIKNDQILAYCKQNGLYVGALKWKVNKKAIEQSIINDFSDLSWFTIQIKGTKATVKLTETVPKVEIVDTKTPCDVVASADGLIADIVTISGTPKVKAKDVVQKGDLLVSSEIIVKEDETGIIKEYTHAKAEVRAKRWIEINFSVPLSYSEKQFTGKQKTAYRLVFVNTPLTLYNPNIPFVDYEKQATRKQLKANDDYVLPVVLVTERYKEFKPVQKTKTIDEAKEEAQTIVTNRILREFDFESDIMDKTIDFTESNDALLVHAVITVIERIDAQAMITPDEAGNTNEADTTNDGSSSDDRIQQPTNTQ